MLTFINKDSTSSNVARSTPSERRLINEQSREHRASARRISAGTHARQRPRPSESRSDHVSDQATTCIDSDGSSTIDTTKTQSERLVHASSLPHADTAKSSSRLQVASTSKPAHSISALPTTKPSSSITSITIPIPSPNPLGNPIDPFQTTDTPLTSTTIHLLHYYKSIYFTSLWTTIHETLTPLLSGNTTIPHCTPDDVIRDALHDRNRMSCLLANTGSHMSMMSTGPYPGTSSSSPSFEITNLALLQRGTSSLREMLSRESHPDNDVLMSAMHLYLAAARMGRTGNAYAHLRGIRALVEGILSRGGDIAGANLGVLMLIDGDLAVKLLIRGMWMFGDGSIGANRNGRVLEVSS